MNENARIYRRRILVQANLDLPRVGLGDCLNKNRVGGAAITFRRVRPHLANMSLGKAVGSMREPSSGISSSDVLRLGLCLQIPRLVTRRTVKAGKLLNRKSNKCLGERGE